MTILHIASNETYTMDLFRYHQESFSLCHYYQHPLHYEEVKTPVNMSSGRMLEIVFPDSCWVIFVTGDCE